ncbi:Endoribonuclease dcr-1 [Echinococcus granulosus]|uniref:Endoribonuclease dcr-1 n=1 Tax=Echinococcus granulosus TaxID=6210 RepID=W6UPW6_ECHGR|nr:Endoribonuclease dcr-1 [Echinococcus granulosus]EUB60332.1 Endoribonuclease dcr-1 [Echinococcus granulosus]
MKRSLPAFRETKLLEPRPYQVEIANMARNESIIVKLSTGLGKSFIAAMVIKDHLPETYCPVTEGGKRIIFVAKTAAERPTALEDRLWGYPICSPSYTNLSDNNATPGFTGYVGKPTVSSSLKVALKAL